MSAQNNGGSYHPIIHSSMDGSGAATCYQTEANWTVRDEFAAKAMAATLSGIVASGSAVEAKHHEGLAKMAYVIADAMLAARETE